MSARSYVLLTKQQTMERLGLETDYVIRVLIQQRKLRPVKFGKFSRLRFRSSQVDDYLASLIAPPAPVTTAIPTVGAQSPAPPPVMHTVESDLNRWLELQAIGKRPQTQRYLTEISAIIRSRWPGIETLVAHVTDAQCAEFAKSIAPFSAPRYNACVNALRRFIPAAIIIPRRRYIATPKNVPTPDEFNRLLAALDVAQQGNAGLVVRFLAQTGIRINEARQLKWPDVRVDHIFLPDAITKNGRPRCVPFVNGTREVIDALRRVPKYHHDRRGFVLPQGHCTRALKFACRFVGLPRLSHHTFRHYFATQCIKSGVDIPTVAKWLGHSDNGVLLLKTYCHLIDEHTTEMAKRVKAGGLPPDATREGANVIALIQPEVAATAPIDKTAEPGAAMVEAVTQEK